MKRGLYFASGLLVGMALFGGGTAYAAGLMASPSSQTFYVAGQQVYLQAYAIGGNNYVKLRDIGQAVDFGVTYLNDYLCGLMSYDRKATAGVGKVFTQHSGEIAGACGSYAHNFKFLCGAAGIPCFTVSTTDHSWNLVYADGQWLHVDVSANDLYRRDYILLAGTVQNRADTAPEATAFLKELLVPGSTSSK